MAISGNYTLPELLKADLLHLSGVTAVADPGGEDKKLQIERAKARTLFYYVMMDPDMYVQDITQRAAQAHVAVDARITAHQPPYTTEEVIDLVAGILLTQHAIINNELNSIYTQLDGRKTQGSDYERAVNELKARGTALENELNGVGERIRQNSDAITEIEGELQGYPGVVIQGRQVSYDANQVGERDLEAITSRVTRLKRLQEKLDTAETRRNSIETELGEETPPGSGQYNGLMGDYYAALATSRAHGAGTERLKKEMRDLQSKAAILGTIDDAWTKDHYTDKEAILGGRSERTNATLAFHSTPAEITSPQDLTQPHTGYYQPWEEMVDRLIGESARHYAQAHNLGRSIWATSMTDANVNELVVDTLMELYQQGHIRPVPVQQGVQAPTPIDFTDRNIVRDYVAQLAVPVVATDPVATADGVINAIRQAGHYEVDPAARVEPIIRDEVHTGNIFSPLEIRILDDTIYYNGPAPRPRLADIENAIALVHNAERLLGTPLERAVYQADALAERFQEVIAEHQQQNPAVALPGLDAMNQHMELLQQTLERARTVVAYRIEQEAGIADPAQAVVMQQLQQRVIADAGALASSPGGHDWLQAAAQLMVTADPAFDAFGILNQIQGYVTDFDRQFRFFDRTMRAQAQLAVNNWTPSPDIFLAAEPYSFASRNNQFTRDYELQLNDADRRHASMATEVVAIEQGNHPHYLQEANDVPHLEEWQYLTKPQVIFEQALAAEQRHIVPLQDATAALLTLVTPGINGVPDPMTELLARLNGLVTVPGYNALADHVQNVSGTLEGLRLRMAAQPMDIPQVIESLSLVSAGPFQQSLSALVSVIPAMEAVDRAMGTTVYTAAINDFGDAVNGLNASAYSYADAVMHRVDAEQVYTTGLRRVYANDPNAIAYADNSDLATGAVLMAATLTHAQQRLTFARQRDPNDPVATLVNEVFALEVEPINQTITTIGQQITGFEDQIRQEQQNLQARAPTTTIGRVGKLLGGVTDAVGHGIGFAVLEENKRILELEKGIKAEQEKLTTAQEGLSTTQGEQGASVTRINDHLNQPQPFAAGTTSIVAAVALSNTQDVAEINQRFGGGQVAP